LKPVARDFVISLAIPLGLELNMESQPLVNLVDLDLPAPDGNYLLETLLRRVDAFHNEWIKEDPFSPCNGILLRWHIDNFGIHGTTYLLSKLGIQKPEKGFLETAEASWTPLGKGSFYCDVLISV